jgi:nucleotide-binding universal stress UspA family protein
MYKRILIGVDSSEHSEAAAHWGLALAEAFDAQLTGAYVDTQSETHGKMTQLAASLPGFDASGLNVEARPHPRALDHLMSSANDKQLFYRPMRLNGTAFNALNQHIADSKYELVILGAKGESNSQLRPLGSVTERLIRTAHVDTSVVKRPEDLNLTATDDDKREILVCVDGSGQSYASLLTAIEFGERYGRPVKAVAVYDPYIHYTLFNSIVKVLTAKASKVFKFADQEKLHEEIIDTGLAKIYQAHLEVARTVAEEKNVHLDILLLDGKAFEKVLQQARKTPPWLLIMGRIGVHSKEGMDIGSNAANILISADSNILVVSRTHTPAVDKQAAESVDWTPPALKKMERVPDFVRGVATTAVLRWAMERGHSVITPGLINKAMGDLLPPDAAQAMGYIAEDIAIKQDDLATGKTFICQDCGYACRDLQPVACSVCEAPGKSFQMIDRAVLESIGSLEGGALEEETMADGKKLKWAKESKDIVSRVPKGYERRRAKARIEKTARVRGLTLITPEFTLDMIQQDLAETSYLSEAGERMKVAISAAERPNDVVAVPRRESEMLWTQAAWKRICRVPGGFMRNMTRERVEGFATSKGTREINLELCEEGITEGRKMMADMIGDYSSTEEFAARLRGSGLKKPATDEATVEATAEATVEATAEATVEATAEATVEATAEATVEATAEENLVPNFAAAKDAEPKWSENAEEKLDSAAQLMSNMGKFSSDRAEQLGRNVAEKRAIDKKMDRIGSAFMAKLGKQLGYGHPLSADTAKHEFTWTAEAEAELADIPDFCREMTKWRVEWTAVKKNLGTIITPEIMEAKYEMWGEVSEAYMDREGGYRLKWADDTKARIDNIPSFVKGQVIESIEGNAQQWGVELVDNAVLEKVIQKWIDTGDFHEQSFGYQ